MELTKEYFDQVTSGLATKDDLASEVRPLQAQLATIENKLDRLSTRTSEDDVVTMKDLEHLTGRVQQAGNATQELQAQHTN